MGELFKSNLHIQYIHVIWGTKWNTPGSGWDELSWFGSIKVDNTTWASSVMSFTVKDTGLKRIESTDTLAGYV